MKKKGCHSLLIITSSGGGGLLQAAKAKEQQAKRENPGVRILKRDLLRDWLSKVMGRFCCNLYDRAQKKGSVQMLEFVSDKIKYFDILFGPRIFFSMFFLLMKEEIDYVIDMQPLCTSAIVKATRFHNLLKKKQVIIEKVLVDLPTEKAKWFFTPIKKLSDKDRNIFKFVSVEPLLKEGQTADAFWQKYCRYYEKEVCYKGYFIRESFEKYRDLDKSNDFFSVTTQCKSDEEMLLLQRVLAEKEIKTNFHEDRSVTFTMDPNAMVITILLGSQPAFAATISYVTKMIELAKNYNKPIHIFAFCAHHKEGNRSLFRALCEELEEVKNYPPHITAIPLSFQEEDVIAALFHRSDLTCTRSGGQTCMELMTVMKGEIWIHSERKSTKEMSVEDLLKGIPKWEAGNALYLRKKRGAHIVTPQTFDEDFITFLEKEDSVVDQVAH